MNKNKNVIYLHGISEGLPHMIDSFYDEQFPLLNIDADFFLREQLPTDTEAFLAYYSDPQVARYILATNPKDLAEARAEIYYCRELFKLRKGIYWSLARKEDDRMIGAIGLYINNQHHRAEICYDLGRSYWKRGIMTKAIRIVLDFCFNHVGIKRIEAVTLEENQASCALLRKLNFQHEGVLKNYRYFKGASYDVEIFALTAEIANNRSCSPINRL